MKIAILTNLWNFNSGYSLTGIVRDQVCMLSKYGHQVDLFVREDLTIGRRHGLPNFGKFTLRTKVPAYREYAYQSVNDISQEHIEYAENLMGMMAGLWLEDFDLAITHDWLFTDYHLPLDLAVKMASPLLPKLRWLHWIHSVPSARRDWWNIKEYGKNHKLVYSNHTDRCRVAAQWGAEDKWVRHIPPTKDLRTWGRGFSRDSWEFIDNVPAFLQADIIQLYPISASRLEAKGLLKLIYLFKELKARGRSVCLAIADSEGTGREPAEDRDYYLDVARQNGLKPGEEIVFTSHVLPQWDKGVPGYAVEELQGLTNLFVFPTEAESFGLVFAEAALAGGGIPVLNRDLSVMYEVSGSKALYLNFGSCEKQLNVPNEQAHYEQMARMIVARWKDECGVQEKTWVRQNLNLDAVYQRHYEPVLAESQTWG